MFCIMIKQHILYDMVVLANCSKGHFLISKYSSNDSLRIALKCDVNHFVVHSKCIITRAIAKERHFQHRNQFSTYWAPI